MALPASLRLVHKTSVGGFIVARYRSAEPIKLRPESVVASQDLPDSLIYVLQGRS